MLHSLTFLSQKVYLQTLPKLQIHLPIMKFGDFMCLKILQRLPLHHLWWKRHPSGLECWPDYHTEWCASRELLLLKPWLFVGSCCDCKEVTRWMHLCPAQSEFCSAPCQGAAFSRSFRCKSSPSHWCDPVPNWVVCSINKCLTKNRRKHTTRPLGQVVHGKKKSYLHLCRMIWYRFLRTVIKLKDMLNATGSPRASCKVLVLFPARRWFQELW